MKNYKELLQDAESLFKDVTHRNSRHSDDTGKLLAAAVIGLAVGGILGILFAPSAGSQTRSTIADSVGELSGTVREKARVGIDKLNDLKNQAVDTVRTKVNGSVETETAV
ncbi:YtxH domain-containing protein [Pedobacter sp. P351]|uniref:YtxH domain-containing protein n=1 Tax=Pedobacter superstes TaxID=3133441 RepID=UPI0030A61CC0